MYSWYILKISYFLHIHNYFSTTFKRTSKGLLRVCLQILKNKVKPLGTPLKIIKLFSVALKDNLLNRQKKTLNK